MSRLGQLAQILGFWGRSDCNRNLAESTLALWWVPHHRRARLCWLMPPCARGEMSATGMRHQIKAELGCSFDTITRALRQHARPGTAAP